MDASPTSRELSHQPSASGGLELSTPPRGEGFLRGAPPLPRSLLRRRHRSEEHVTRPEVPGRAGRVGDSGRHRTP